MDYFDLSIITHNLGYLSQGLMYTVQLTLVALCGGVLLGTGLAVMRTSSIKILSWGATVYINIFRSVPLVQVIFAFYMVVPFVLGLFLTHPVPIGAERSAYITFTVFEAAYYAEIIRSGIKAVSSGQMQAGSALGLRPSQVMCSIILPQAFRHALPILLTQTIVLFQDVSLVYVIGATDFLGAADKINQRDLRPVEMYSLVAVVYFFMCVSLSYAVRQLQHRMTVAR